VVISSLRIRRIRVDSWLLFFAILCGNLRNLRILISADFVSFVVKFFVSDCRVRLP